MREWNMKKIIIPILLIIAMAFMMLTGCYEEVKRAETNLDFDNLGAKPNEEVASSVTPIDKSKVTLSSETTTDKAVLDSIKYIIQLSNQNNIDLDFYAAAAYGTGDAKINYTDNKKIVGSMDTREFRVYDNGEYFFDTYGLVVDGYTLASDGTTGTVPEALIGMLATVLDYAERVYSPDGKTFYKADNGRPESNCFELYPSLDAVVYKRPSIEKSSEEEYIKNNYYRNSYREYTSDDLSYEEAITSGKITYDEEAGIYYIECEINCENEITLDLSIKSMKESSGTDVFKYAKKTLVLEIWDCGLIKNYINKNVWEATLLPTSIKLKGSSENFYEQRFMYNKEDLDKMIVPDSVKQALVK